MPIGYPSIGIDETGVALTWQKITPGNTATSIDSSIYKYEERTLAYTSGGTTELTAGMVIVGATSAAVAIIKSLTLTSGSWAAGTAAGTLTLCSQVGTFQSENVFTDDGSNDATIAGDSTASTADYGYKDYYAKKLILQVLDNDAIVSIGPMIPDQTKKMGLHIPNKGTLDITDRNQMKACKVIDAVASSASNVIIVGIF
jgi:hypothetical protein